MSSTTTLRGQVHSTRVIRDGWGTLELLAGSDDGRVSVTGHPLGIEAGDTVEVTGSWQTHPRYGRQFRADAIRVVAPSDAAGAIAWICSRLPGVGRKRATAMVERWPLPDVWEVLRERPWELAVHIPGITPARAAHIGTQYREVEHERERIVALRGYGLTDRQAANVVAKWGAETLETLRADPYQLSQIYGFGFKRSDAIAQKMGLPANHPSRIRAGLEHMLEEARGHGHCFVPAGKLIAMTARMLSEGAVRRVTEAEVVREGRAFIDAGRATQREGRGAKGESVARVYLADVDEAEAAVVRAVVRLVRGGVGAGVGAGSERDGREQREGEAA